MVAWGSVRQREASVRTLEKTKDSEGGKPVQWGLTLDGSLRPTCFGVEYRLPRRYKV